jgi:hypothetical protein
MTELHDVPIFLSASFPSDDERGRRFPADPGIVGDAVAAVSVAILRSGARIVSGLHPTISPLLLFICDQSHWHHRLEIYQSERYRDKIPEETWRLTEMGFGALHFTPSVGDLEEDLQAMRHELLDKTRPGAAIFIGGMEGILKEWEMCIERGIFCLPVPASGGAAAQLSEPDVADPESRLLLTSQSFALVGREIVRLIRDRIR